MDCKLIIFSFIRNFVRGMLIMYMLVKNALKACFHWRRSHSRSRSRSSASDPKSRIGVERRVVNWTELEECERFHFLPIPLKALTHNLIQWIPQKRKNQPITLRVLRPSDGLRLRQSSFHWVIGDGVVRDVDGFLQIPSIWFSLDRIPLLLRLRLWL